MHRWSSAAKQLSGLIKSSKKQVSPSSSSRMPVAVLGAPLSAAGFGQKRTVSIDSGRESLGRNKLQ